MAPTLSVSGGPQDHAVIASAPGLFEILRDDRLDILRVNGLRVQRAEDVDRYLAALGDAARELRARRGRVLVFADLRHSPVRTQEAAERMRSGNLKLYRPGDRVAMLVESSLLKMQLRRHLIEEYQNIFLSENAALTWLTARD